MAKDFNSIWKEAEIVCYENGVRFDNVSEDKKGKKTTAACKEYHHLSCFTLNVNGTTCLKDIWQCQKDRTTISQQSFEEWKYPVQGYISAVSKVEYVKNTN